MNWYEEAKEIEELEYEIQKRKEEVSENNECCNNDCAYFNEKTTGHCNWSHLTVLCRDYIQE